MMDPLLLWAAETMQIMNSLDVLTDIYSRAMKLMLRVLKTENFWEQK